MPDEYGKSDLQKVSAALNQILQFNLQRASGDFKRLLQRRPLYHYTTAEGLKGIVEENELWATSAYFLNDAAEITYGYGVISDAIEKWLADNPRPANSFCLCFARDIQRGFGHDLSEANRIEPIYLACFCEEDNLLSQWRAYGQSGGYSIGFNVGCEGAVAGLRPEPNTYTAKCVKVEYNRKKQVERCQAILDAVLPIFDNSDVVRAVEAVRNHAVLGYPGIRRVVAELLEEEVLGFKNPAFEVEREWRVIVRKRELFKQGRDDGGRTAPPIHFRALRGALVPYVKLLPTQGTLPIACVRSGPTFDEVTAGMSIRMLLDSNSFGDAQVAGSSIPVRF